MPMTEKQRESDPKSTEKPAAPKKRETELSEQDLKEVSGGLMAGPEFPEEEDPMLP
jgi:hypothetical protein